jgi:hypothetical protein
MSWCPEKDEPKVYSCTDMGPWPSGQTGVEGNEKADQLVNKGSDTYFIGHEPFFGYNNTKYKKILDK